MNQDLIGLLGGMNIYAYPHAPTGWVDPMGLEKCGTSPSERNDPQRLRDYSGGITLTIDLPISLMSKVNNFFTGGTEQLPDIGFAISLMTQPLFHPDGPDIGLVVSRRAGGTAAAPGFSGKITGAIEVNRGSIKSLAGSGYDASVQAGVAGASWLFDESNKIRGSSFNLGAGISAGATAETSSAYTVRTGYTPSSCNDFVC